MRASVIKTSSRYLIVHGMEAYVRLVRLDTQAYILLKEKLISEELQVRPVTVLRQMT